MNTSDTKSMNGYNLGDQYEELILQICIRKGITPIDFKRGGAGSKSDIIFNHKGSRYALEVKANTSADFGQKMLRWENGTWSWSKKDEITELYTSLGILDLIQQKDLVPNLYTILKEKLTIKHRKIDRQAFESSVPIDTEKLFLYYSLKGCHYIQIGGYGFYYLDQDILKLGVPQFDGKLRLRLRAKTVHSFPIWNYAYYAVLKIETPPTRSAFDLEEIDGRTFPPIVAGELLKF